MEEHKITFGTLSPDGSLTDIRLIKQSDVGRCPHVILVPEHYREDGSCKCDDPNHCVEGGEIEMEKHVVTEENAEKFWKWIHERGGIAIWKSVNLANPGGSWSCPVNDETGNKKGKPTWEAANEPERIITDPAEIEVSIPKEVRRLHVALRRGSQGLSWKLTDNSSRRLRNAVARTYDETGKNSWYEFDYVSQEAVIYIDGQLIPLIEYILW